jgi:hypothetical protein
MGLMLFLAGCGGDAEPPPVGQEEQGAPNTPGQGPPAGEGVPRARIEVDGRASDWRSVPVLLDVPTDKPRKTNYDCKAIKVACDKANLYVLLTLGVGVGERHEQQMEREGKATSGAIGHLYLTSRDAKFSLWIPTGFRSSYDMEADELTNEPYVRVEVSRVNEGEGSGETIFEAEAAGQADNVAFAGKHLELAIPLRTLGITGEAPMEATLDEM